MAAIAALSVHSAIGGMNSSAPIVCRHRFERRPKGLVGRDAAADGEPSMARLLQRLPRLGDQHLDDRRLE